MAVTVIDLSRVGSFPVRLTDASNKYVGRIVLQVIGGGTYSITPQAQLRGSSSSGANLTSVPYTNRGSGSGIGAGTAITAAGIYEVDATGVEIWLAGSYSSGAGGVQYQVLEG